MFKKSLVGVDFSPSSQALLSCLPDLEQWGVETLILAHVIRIGYGQGSGYGKEDAYLERIARLAEPLSGSGMAVEPHVTASSAVAEELVALSGRTQCDLLVLGSRSHNFLHDIFLGSVAKEAIRLADRPVLIERLEPVRSGVAETCAAVCRQALTKVLLATDHSDRAQTAQDAALGLAGSAGQIDCLTVLADNASDAELAATQAAQAELVEALIRAGTKAQAIIARGVPDEAILRASADNYSLILIGKNGQNWLASKVIGSTTAAVCERARIPVLMVPLQNN